MPMVETIVERGNFMYTAEEVIVAYSLVSQTTAPTEWHNFVIRLFAQTHIAGWKALLLLLPQRTLRKVLSDPTMSQEALAWCAINANTCCREYVAHNIALPQNIFKRLAVDMPNVRMAVASNGSISKTLLEDLSEDPDKYVRMRIAANPITPAHLIRKLENDSSVVVRYAATRNRLAPYEQGKTFGFRGSPFKKRYQKMFINLVNDGKIL